MRLFIFFIFISFCIAEDSLSTNNLESNNDASENINTELSAEEVSTLNDDSTTSIDSIKAKQAIKEAVLSSESINTDEKLKDDIVHFNRVAYGDTMNNIKDPFIYVNQQSEEELANIDKIQKTKLVLYAVFNNKAKVNNSWVVKNDKVDGWTVTDIKNDRVELKFNTETRILYVYSRNNKFDIK